MEEPLDPSLHLTDGFCLIADSSVILTITYEDFDELPPGNYDAYFGFPAPHYNVAREDLDQENGRIWLGDLDLYAEVLIQ